MEKKSFELLAHRDRPAPSGDPSRYLPGRAGESYRSIALTAFYIAIGSFLYFMGYLYWIAPPRHMSDWGAMTLISTMCAACFYLFTFAFMSVYEAVQRRIGK